MAQCSLRSIVLGTNDAIRDPEAEPEDAVFVDESRLLAQGAPTPAMGVEPGKRAVILLYIVEYLFKTDIRRFTTKSRCFFFKKNIGIGTFSQTVDYLFDDFGRRGGVRVQLVIKWPDFQLCLFI